MATRKLENKAEYTIIAKATAAITNNPAAGTGGGGLAVKLDTDPNYFVVAGVGDAPIGVVDENIEASANATIYMSGLRPVRLGGTVAALDFLECGAAGVLVKATGLRPILGQALQAGVSGDFVTCIIGKKPDGPIVGADVASAATIVPTGEVFTVTGSTGITAITATGISNGKRILIRAGTATAAVTLAHMAGGTITLSADDELELEWDGSSWHEVGRSVNA